MGLRSLPLLVVVFMLGEGAGKRRLPDAIGGGRCVVRRARVPSCGQSWLRRWQLGQGP